MRGFALRMVAFPALGLRLRGWYAKPVYTGLSVDKPFRDWKMRDL